MKAVISPLYYNAPISVYIQFLKHDAIWIEASENYQKGSFRNKSIIGTAQGPLTLSIPLQKGKHQKRPIREVGISQDSPWKDIHLRSIRTAYGNTPYFEHYFDAITSIFEQEHLLLWDLNWQLFQSIQNWLGWSSDIQLTDRYEGDIYNLDYRKQRMFSREIEPYPQVHESSIGFISDLSILDLLFHLGPESAIYLADSASKF